MRPHLIACGLIAALSPAAYAADGGAIGIVSASGHFTVEGSEVWGNATLFDGAAVETTDASSQLALSNGVKVQLAAGSAARVYANRLVLERGMGQVTAPSSFNVDSSGLTVAVDGGRVQVGVGEEVLVASLSGTARVLRAANVLATIPAGSNRAFAMLQTVSRTGCLLFKDGGFIMQVDDSPEVVQLTGSDLAANVGNRVEAQGTVSGAQPSIAPATSVIAATSITQQGQGGCLSAALALNAQTSVGQVAAQGAAPAPTAPAAGPAPLPAGGGGMSTGAKVALIGLIGGGGAGAAIALSGKKDSTSP